ncbi:hypothetical protein ABLA30_03890 [Xenorhabdus nematophila]|uniref:hypothetical protein n=1 Tax=Xenorhabdus nematophila TaxID=628 RepID=UPI0032B77C36
MKLNLIDKCVDAIESLVAKTAENITGRPMQYYCNLDTVVPLTEFDVQKNPSLKDSYIYTNECGELITMFDLQGIYRIVGSEQYIDMVSELSRKMTPYLNKPGHEVWFSYEQDPDRALDEASLIIAPQLSAARRMNLDVSDVILERLKLNAARCHFEQNLVVFKTCLSAIPQETLKEELKIKIAEAKKGQFPVFGQNLHTIYQSVKNLHETFIERFQEDFRTCSPLGGVLLERLSAAEAAKRYRIMVDRENTAQNYRPHLIDNGLYPRGNLSHIDDYLPPKLKWQICSTDAEQFENTRHIASSELLHGNLQMELGPLEEKPFSSLLANIDSSLPFRATYRLTPCGLNNYKLRKLVSGLMGFTDVGKRTYKTLQNLEEIDKEMPVVGLQVTFSTWAKDKITLTRRLSSLQAAIQSWGVSGVEGAHGDPMKHWMSTVPAFSNKNPAPILTPPLANALFLMPFERPAAINRESGWVLIRTPDGKIVPGHLYPTNQDTWIELFVGTPGSGKSLWLNVLNFHFMVAPGYVRLPMACILDVGSSSAGLISLLQDALPDDKKHQVQSVRLLNASEFTTNIFDTQLGLRYPLPIESRFQGDFLTLLCLNPETGSAPDGVAGLMAKLIKNAYADTAEGSGQIIYSAGVNKIVDACLNDMGLIEEHDSNWWESATWWEVVDMLFEAKCLREATIAQRYAVPTLNTIARMLNKDEIKTEYSGVIINGQDILMFVQRKLSDAATMFPLLSGYTRFELSSETRFVSFDLAAVLGGDTPSGRWQNGIFYMLGRYMGTKNFFLDADTFFTHCPNLYRKYHEERIKDIQSEKKSIIADESHNFSGIRIIEATFEKDALQGRKLGIRLGLCSQYLRHFSPDILRSATSIYVMKGGSPDDAEILRKQFNLSDSALIALDRDCKGPSPAGANFLGIFKTKKGNIIQILNNSASPTELWAYNTNQLDMSIRDALTKEFGSSCARRHLVKKFPSGTAIPLLESMRKDNSLLNNDKKENQTVVSLLVEMLSNEIKNNNRGRNV